MFIGMEWYWWLLIVVALVICIPLKVKFMKWWSKREQEKKKNQTGGDYLSLSVSTGHGRLNANLGRFPGQDDEDLMAVIPWD